MLIGQPFLVSSRLSPFSITVLDTEVASTDLSVGLSAVTLNGGLIFVESLDPPTINEAVVVTADIEADNGIVHIIDAVLVPPPTITELAVDTEDLSTLVDLLGRADLVETLSGDGPFTVFA
jgi:transforming growth factor-beta-induced protein